MSRAKAGAVDAGDCRGRISGTRSGPLPPAPRADGRRAAGRLQRHAGAPAAILIATLNAYLYEELGFSGNREHYDDPRNSFLNEVLDRRLGIPISLAVVYLEIGRRAGCVSKA